MLRRGVAWGKRGFAKEDDVLAEACRRLRADRI